MSFFISDLYLSKKFLLKTVCKVCFCVVENLEFVEEICWLLRPSALVGHAKDSL